MCVCYRHSIGSLFSKSGGPTDSLGPSDETGKFFETGNFAICTMYMLFALFLYNMFHLFPR